MVTEFFYSIRRTRIMNLINKKVTHKRFGVGSIVKHNDSSIEIDFASENKKFVLENIYSCMIKVMLSHLKRLYKKRKMKEKKRN